MSTKYEDKIRFPNWSYLVETNAGLSGHSANRWAAKVAKYTYNYKDIFLNTKECTILDKKSLTIDMVDVIRPDLLIVGLFPAQRQLIADAVRERLWLRVSETMTFI